jgi:predicted RND superfamily exporter protein
MPVLGRFMIDLSRRALVRTGLLATAVVLLLVVSEIGFSRWALVAVTPTLLGVAAMLGAMRLLGVAWNPINVMALPVVIGTAVDAGIHVTHRFLVDRGNLVAAVAGSCRAVLLSSLTTLAGFGALVFTSHRGLASFATVLVVGVLAGLVLSLFLLPQLLRLAWHLERGEPGERPLAG